MVKSSMNEVISHKLPKSITPEAKNPWRTPNISSREIPTRVSGTTYHQVWVCMKMEVYLSNHRIVMGKICRSWTSGFQSWFHMFSYDVMVDFMDISWYKAPFFSCHPCRLQRCAARSKGRHFWNHARATDGVTSRRELEKDPFLSMFYHNLPIKHDEFPEKLFVY